MIFDNNRIKFKTETYQLVIKTILARLINLASSTVLGSRTIQIGYLRQVFLPTKIAKALNQALWPKMASGARQMT